MPKHLIRSVGVAVLFAACGASSSGLYADQGTGSAFVGLPFALLCTLLTMRRRSPVLVVLLISFLWPVARMSAVAIDMITADAQFLSVGVAGLIGGSGVAASIGIGHRRLLSPLLLAGAAVVGLLAALSFGPWLVSHDAHLNTWPDPTQPSRLAYAFAIWQASIGVYVYLCAGKKMDKTRLAD
jgi:hypothetical protein